MENLDQQTQIINLGKALVAELKLESGVDTLSKWMAHYIAEKITLVESLPKGKAKKDAEKECFETILALWERRWTLPSNKHSLGKFEPILRTLERISPDVKEPYWYHSVDHSLSELENGNPELKSVLQFTALALEVDKVARIWIDALLGIAAKKAITEEARTLLNNAVNLHDNDDVLIIRSFLNNKSDSEDSNLKYERQKLKKRIADLEKFSKISELLSKGYEADLADIDQGKSEKTKK